MKQFGPWSEERTFPKIYKNQQFLILSDGGTSTFLQKNKNLKKKKYITSKMEKNIVRKSSKSWVLKVAIQQGLNKCHKNTLLNIYSFSDCHLTIQLILRTGHQTDNNMYFQIGETNTGGFGTINSLDSKLISLQIVQNFNPIRHFMMHIDLF